MKRILLIILLLNFASFAAEATLPDSSIIKKALLSEKDQYGIPNELYKIDDKLDRYKSSIEYRSQSNKRNGTGILIGGIVGLVSSGILFAVAANNASKAAEMRNSPNMIVIYDPSPMQYTLAVTDGILSIVCMGVGIGMMNRAADTEPMKQYFNKTYSPYLSTKAIHLFFSLAIY